MKRRALIAAALVALAALALAPEALALGGGGSSSFGGGGGGGGGGHGGSGFFIYIILRLFIDLAIHQPIVAAIIVGLIVLWYGWARMTRRTQAAREDAPSDHVSKRTLGQRERRVELAAAEAAEDDPAFAPDAVRTSAGELFRQVEAAWDARDRTKLSRLVGPDLMKEWTRRLDDFQARGWHNRVQPLEEPRVDYVGLSRAGGGVGADGGDGGGEDGEANAGRVVVRIEARMKDYVEDGTGRHIKRTGYFTETVRLMEYWTLSRIPPKPGQSQNGQAIGWILASIEQAGEGKHALEDKIVGTAWADEGALRDEALVEGAVAQAVPDGTKVSEVADLQFEGGAQAAANDLSVADGRFAPDVLEVAARRAVAAWAEAVDGDDAALDKLADPAVVRELLYPDDPGGRIRLVVRGPKVNRIRVVGLDAGATPPTMTIEVDVQGHRYLQNRDTAAVVGGSKARSVGFTERWTFALSDDPRQPWRICAAGSQPARA
jgi:predicted lipid-binding transport protein (Tim44 family)